MRVVKPNQLSLLTRPFEYRQKAYLGFSILAGLPLTKLDSFLFEADLWKRVSPLLGESGVLDAGIPKSRGEFLAIGSAFADQGNPTSAMRVSISVGEVSKELNVFGDRFFEGERITEPLPFERMPIDWHHAFGGEKFNSNPHGKGLNKITSGENTGRLPLPNVEHPKRLLRLKSQRPEPASFGSTEVTSPARLALAGTYDDHWLKTAFPGFPNDIRWEYFNSAQPDQWSDKTWQGGESFRIVGMHPNQPVIEGLVPEYSLRCFFRMKGDQGLHEAITNLTTLWFFPDLDLIVPIYQGSIRITESDAFDVDTLVIAAEGPAESRAIEHYRHTLERRLAEDASFMDLIRDDPLMPEGLARSPADSIIANLNDGSGSSFVRNLRTSIDSAIASAQRKTEELGHSFPVDQLPAWPEQGNTPPIEELDQFFEEKMRDLEHAVKEARQKETEARSLVQAELDKKPDFDQSLDVIDSDADQRGPPQFSAKALRNQIRQSCEQVRAMGSDPSEMESMLNDPEIFKFWLEAEAGLNDLYRLGAHYQKPVIRSIEDASRLGNLRKMLSDGKSVADHDFSGLDLSGQDLSKQDLSGIFLESAVLRGCNLSGAKLDRVVLAHANLENCCLDGASLKNANLGKSKMIGVSARGSQLIDTILSGALIDKCDFSESRIEGMQTFFQAMVSQSCFAGVIGNELLFLDMELIDCDFRECRLKDAIFIQCDLSQSTWDDATIDEAVWVSCIAREASFARAGLFRAMFAKESDFSQSDFSDSCLDQANFRDARLMNCLFHRSRMNGADLSNVSAGGSSFRLANAADSQWVRADLRDADLAGCHLTNGVLHKADLRGADLRQANLHASDLARAHVDRTTRFDGALTTRMNTYPRRFNKDLASDA